MISFGNRTAEVEVKVVSPLKDAPLFQTIFMRNSTFIRNGLNRDPPVNFTTEGVCRSILGALMADYVYEHAQEWVKDADVLMRRNKPAAGLFIAWANHIGSRDYGICDKIDFMVPNDYRVIIDTSVQEALDAKVQAYLKDLEIGPFQQLLMEIAKDWEKIRIDWEMFQDKNDPKKQFPYDFIQWISRPVGARKRYYRLTHIDPSLTCGRVLELSISKILNDSN